MKNAEIEKILSSDAINGGQFWSRSDGDIHAPAGYSAIDVLNTLGDLGVKYTDFKIIQDAIDFIFTYYQADGNFRYSPSSSKLPCITARILTALGRLGFSDSRNEECYRLFLNTQMPDGGWRCNTVKTGKSPETDASNPGTTLYVLDAFLYRDNSPEEEKVLEKAVLFLLDHWDSRLPLGPCMFGIGTTFLKTEYPMLRYNLLYYCYVLAKYKTAAKDKRFSYAVETLKTRLSDGRLINDNPHRLWRKYSFAQKGKPGEEASRIFRQITVS